MEIHFKKLSHPVLDHHLRHHKNSASEFAALRSFDANLSLSLQRLLSNSSDFLSLPWIKRWFDLHRWMNSAFTKLLKDIDYPVVKWKGAAIEEYLSYTLNMLDILNSISSSVSHLGNSRISISHSLMLISNSSSSTVKELKSIKTGKDLANFGVKSRKNGADQLSIPSNALNLASNLAFARTQNLENIKPRKDSTNFGLETRENDANQLCIHGKAAVIHQAIKKMKDVSLMVCEILLSSLNEYEENSGLGSNSGSGLGLNSRKSAVKEMKDVAAALMKRKTGDESVDLEMLRRRLAELEVLLEDVRKKVNCLFYEVLACRNQLLDVLRLTN